jgi:glucose 1-dehydrogenase
MAIKELLNLKGKTALVTGGSQGIGKAISLALAELGADVIVNYRSGIDKAKATKNEIGELGAKCELLQCDLSQKNAAKAVSKILKQEKISIDILVLNASMQVRKDWNKVTHEEFDLQMDTNFRSSLMLIQELYPVMKQKGWGRILTIGSVQQVRPHQQMVVYAATKMAQVSMVINLAPQFAPYGVTINNLAPGAIATARNEDVLSDKKYKALVESKIPLGYVGEPIDCAGLTLVLCSDAGRYITGQDMFVAGGMSLLI